MATTSGKNLLATAVIVLATMLLPGFAAQAAAQACVPGNPCICDNCCMYLLQEQINCPNGSQCPFWVCIGGLEADQSATSHCTGCPCAPSMISYDYDSGTCGWAGPIRESSASEVWSTTALVFTRGCDGQYAIVRIGSAG